MYNIKQLTNFDVADLTIENKTFRKGGDKGKVVTAEYIIIPTSILGSPITKMGYCCEPCGIDYPIYLTINEVEQMFYLGKTGMFEFQPEDWTDKNGDKIERTSNITVTQIKVPKAEKDSKNSTEENIVYINNPVHFVLDYAYEV